MVLRLFAVASVLGSIACANSPGSPTPAPARPPALTFASAAVVSDAPPPAILGRCLGGSRDASCFSGARVHRTSELVAPIPGVPVLNNNQPVQNSGPTVTLSWTAPAAGVPTSYVIEAASAPGGAANLANFNTGNALTTLVVPDVPAGTYYVRVRAVDASGLSSPSNEVQLIVAATGSSGCPTAPRGLTIASQNAGNLTLTWQAPSAGAPTSYVVQAGSAPNGANLVTFDTNSTALSLVASNVPAGAYFVRVYGRSASCAAPTFLGPSSNEVLLTIGAAATSGWSGQILCQLAITGPDSYHHSETQTWTIAGPGQTSGPRTTYPIVWTAQGSGGGVGKSWVISSTATTDLSDTIVASTGIQIFDRTTTGLVIHGGIVGTPTSFDLFEIDFPTIVASSSTATPVDGTYSRATAGGDSPQQPGGSVGTLTCRWSLAFR